MNRIYWIFVFALVLVGCSQPITAPQSDVGIVTTAPTDTLELYLAQTSTQFANLVTTVTMNPTLQAGQTQNAAYNATQGVKYTQTAQSRGTSSPTPTPRPTKTSTLTPTLTFTPDPNATATRTLIPPFRS